MSIIQISVSGLRQWSEKQLQNREIDQLGTGIESEKTAGRKETAFYF